MPTKIVASKSNPKNGEINQQDLNRIISDFENFVDIKSTIARDFIKIETVTIPVPTMYNLLGLLTDAQKLKSFVSIKFGITLPGQKDCTDGKTDVSNHLTVAVFIDRNGIDLKDQVGDFVITPAFREFSVQGTADGPCCPVIQPPGGSQ